MIVLALLAATCGVWVGSRYGMISLAMGAAAAAVISQLPGTHPADGDLVAHLGFAAAALCSFHVGAIVALALRPDRDRAVDAEPCRPSLRLVKAARDTADHPVA